MAPSISRGDTLKCSVALWGNQVWKINNLKGRISYFGSQFHSCQLMVLGIVDLGLIIWQNTMAAEVCECVLEPAHLIVETERSREGLGGGV